MHIFWKVSILSSGIHKDSLNLNRDGKRTRLDLSFWPFGLLTGLPLKQCVFTALECHPTSGDLQLLCGWVIPFLFCWERLQTRVTRTVCLSKNLQEHTARISRSSPSQRLRRVFTSVCQSWWTAEQILAFIHMQSSQRGCCLFPNIPCERWCAETPRYVF